MLEPAGRPVPQACAAAMGPRNVIHPAPGAIGKALHGSPKRIGLGRINRGDPGIGARFLGARRCLRTRHSLRLNRLDPHDGSDGHDGRSAADSYK